MGSSPSLVKTLTNLKHDTIIWSSVFLLFSVLLIDLLGMPSDFKYLVPDIYKWLLIEEVVSLVSHIISSVLWPLKLIRNPKFS